MKKTTILMAMAALVLSSCAKNEVSEGMPIVNDPNQISFNSSIGTRAPANGLDQVKAGFNVLGFTNGQTDVTTAFIDGKDVNSTYLFTGTPGTWGWTTPAGKNWPEAPGAYPMTFYAEYPKADLSANTDLNKAIVVDLSMADQKDFLIAKSDLIATRPASGFAALKFKHILSNLVFKIKTAKDYTVYIQSIRVVNTATKGRTFDYATMAYLTTEPSYTVDQLATTDGTYKPTEGYFFNKNTGTPWSFNASGGEAEQIKAVDAESGIMMQMPQKDITYWIKGNTTNGLGTFETDAKAWKENGGTSDSWFAAVVGATPNPGMKGSLGWEGARIEVIYRIEDKNGKSIIGRKIDETFKNAAGGDEVATQNYFVRVGFPLDLSAIVGGKGWEMAKRYIYTISLGTADASNGILLDPDYKDQNGASNTPKIPVENPKVDPGQPVTPGLINFDVSVDEWEDNAQGIK